MPRALVFDHYGDLDVLSVREVDARPARAGEVLVRVRAAALNPKDSFVRKGRFALLSGRRFPKRLGVDFAGELADGRRVFGALEEVRYLRGTLADEVLVRSCEWAPMPGSLGFAAAAALPLASLTALQALRDLAKVGAGSRVVIHGASGGVGTVAIQIARWLGAHVTTTSSAENRELCRSLGAHECLDRGVRAGEGVEARLSGGDFDAIFDVFGNLAFGRCRRALGPRGVFVSTVPSPRIVLDAARTAFSAQRAKLVVVRARSSDLATIARMVDAGELRPVIDRVEPFERVREAFAHLETKRARGKIVVSLEPPA